MGYTGQRSICYVTKKREEEEEEGEEEEGEEEEKEGEEEEEKEGEEERHLLTYWFNRMALFQLLAMCESIVGLCKAVAGNFRYGTQIPD